MSFVPGSVPPSKVVLQSLPSVVVPNSSVHRFSRLAEAAGVGLVDLLSRPVPPLTPPIDSTNVARRVVKVLDNGVVNGFEEGMSMSHFHPLLKGIQLLRGGRGLGGRKKKRRKISRLVLLQNQTQDKFLLGIHFQFYQGMKCCLICPSLCHLWMRGSHEV